MKLYVTILTLLLLGTSHANAKDCKKEYTRCNLWSILISSKLEEYEAKLACMEEYVACTEEAQKKSIAEIDAELWECRARSRKPILGYDITGDDTKNNHYSGYAREAWDGTIEATIFSTDGKEIRLTIKAR